MRGVEHPRPAPRATSAVHSSRDRDEQKGVVAGATQGLVRGVWVPGMSMGAVRGGTPAALAARATSAAHSLRDRDKQKGVVAGATQDVIPSTWYYFFL